MPRFLSVFVLIGLCLVLAHPALAQETGKKGEAAPAATVTRTVKVGELTRSYALHVPAELPKDKPAAVMLVFHGGGGTPAQVERQTKFSDLADRTSREGDGFIVVYPEGVGKSWNDGRGAQDVLAQRDNIDDLGFVAALIDDIAKVHKVDANRLFATGISNGAIFSHSLAANLSARIAAIAPVVGGLGEPASEKFAPEKPVSVLILQGTDDPLVPYNGGNVTPPLVGVANKRGRIISTDEAVKKWAAHNGCQPDAVVKDGKDVADTDNGDGCHAKRFIWSKGKDGTEVVLYRIEGGGHTWPGAVEPLPRRLVGNVCRDFNATEIIWEFFKVHPKPANSAPMPASAAAAAPSFRPQRTGVVFSTGFEEDKPGAVWENYDGVLAVTVKDPGPEHREGNTVMRFRAPPGERGGGGVVKVLPDKKGYDKLYARWYVKYEKGFNFDAPGHGSGLHGGERWLNGRSGIRPDGTNMVSVYLDSCNKPSY